MKRPFDSRRSKRALTAAIALTVGLTTNSVLAQVADSAGGPENDPHSRAPAQPLTGSPFASTAHRHQAELLRANRNESLRTQSVPGEGIPPGTIGMLVRNEQNQPVAGAKIKLIATHESIAEGNKETTKETTTDLQGRGGFVGLNTESSYHYETVVEFEGARYSSGIIRLRREVGQIVLLHVFPSTTQLDDTFVITRLLYALQPREDIFQIDAILRIQNGGTKTWAPKDLFLDLPDGALAFRPAKTEGDLRTTLEGNRVRVSGSLTPGQHEFNIGFQLPNPRTANIRLALNTLPNLVDTRVFLESSDTMGLKVAELKPAEQTQGLEGQNALMAAADFLAPDAPAPPAVLAVTVTGMPERGSGPVVASGLAALLALFGVAFAVSRADKSSLQASAEDRTRARDLLLTELVAVESAFLGKQIGPKTYEQARRVLLDSLARLGDKDIAV